MNKILRNKMLNLAEELISLSDVSHDFEHAKRVLFNAEEIAKTENGDLDIIVPAALFHDLVVYPKNHPDKQKSQEESAILAEKLLSDLEDYPKVKIEAVKTCILECSFSKAMTPESIESKIIQDADGLEATGAISIMRTYSSTGQMKRPFYNSEDPFCKERKPDAINYALDLFYERLLKVTERMNTNAAKKISERRSVFLLEFLKELELELGGK